MGKAERKKGVRGELEMVEWLNRVTGTVWRRTPLSGGMHLDFPFDVSKRHRDIETIFDRYGIEVKNTKGLSLPKWIVQCEEAEMDYWSTNLGRHIIFFKHRGKWRVDMPITAFEEFIKKDETQNSIN